MSQYSPKSLSALGLRAPNDIAVTGICVDSRMTKPGMLFAALPGTNLHGGRFIEYALRMDATAILTDPEGAEIAKNELAKSSAQLVITDHPRRALALAASRFYTGQPKIIAAVTGTNGKTSVANFTQQIWTGLGARAVNFGTAGVEGAVDAPLGHTTPEPITLHRLLGDLQTQGVTHAAMEASSHGLVQNRLDGVVLTAAGFTNFSQDHLDYHTTFDAYFDAKMGLFTRVLPKGATAVVNLLDPKGPEVAEIARNAGSQVLTVGSAEADLALSGHRFTDTGQDVQLDWQDKGARVHLPLIGKFQAENICVALGLVLASGAKFSDCLPILPRLQGVRGRMELVAKRTNEAPVYVDYAHTPDAVETALTALRPHVMGRIIVVLGAGGDRDPGKRPLMGKAASVHADLVYVTDDNPRTEDPADIRQQVLAGAPEATEIGDRAHAILAGVDALRSGDALLIAGKGHERGQIIGTDVYPFDDAEQASIAVAALDGLGT
ncbi:MAG: UDP-N-acetylmuramoyl-L-alanyl-D-glutamate--2,6-diaminopimelate ligase [Pseudomonadota bacterium]